jgi:hypothetical protein
MLTTDQHGAADRPQLRFQFPVEKGGEGGVSGQRLFHSLVHLATKEPGIAAVQGLPKGNWQVNGAQGAKSGWNLVDVHSFIFFKLIWATHNLVTIAATSEV